MYLSLSLFLPLSFCWSGFVFSSIWSNVSKVKDKSLKNSSLKVFSKCICHCQYHCLCLSVGQVVFSNHSDQLSQRSKVSKISLFVPKSESVAVQPHIETLSGQQVPSQFIRITSPALWELTSLVTKRGCTTWWDKSLWLADGEFFFSSTTSSTASRASSWSNLQLLIWLMWVSKTQVSNQVSSLLILGILLLLRPHNTFVAFLAFSSGWLVTICWYLMISPKVQTTVILKSNQNQISQNAEKFTLGGEDLFPPPQHTSLLFSLWPPPATWPSC